MDPSDEALVAGLAAQDRDAAVAFVRRFQRRVFGLALTVTGDPAVAEDVAQDAFARVWRLAAAYDARRGSVATWLLAITRNLAIDAIRLRRPVPSDPATLAALVTGAEPAADEASVQPDELRHLRAAVRDLPTDQRRAIVMAGLEGRTAKEVAEVEGIPLGTAKSRIRAGLGKLRAALVEGSRRP